MFSNKFLLHSVSFALISLASGASPGTGLPTCESANIGSSTACADACSAKHGSSNHGYAMANGLALCDCTGNGIYCGPATSGLPTCESANIGSSTACANACFAQHGSSGHGYAMANGIAFCDCNGNGIHCGPVTSTLPTCESAINSGTACANACSAKHGSSNHGYAVTNGIAICDCTGNGIYCGPVTSGLPTCESANINSGTACAGACSAKHGSSNHGYAVANGLALCDCTGNGIYCGPATSGLPTCESANIDSCSAKRM